MLVMPAPNPRKLDTRPFGRRDLRQLRHDIASRYDELSQRQQQVARYALDHPTDVALQTVTVLAQRAKVQPSSFVRFAQAFGFTGFSDMQRVFQAEVAAASSTYSERLRSLQPVDGLLGYHRPTAMLRQLCAAHSLSLDHLQETIDEAKLEQAVHVLSHARHIYVVGHEHSFAIAAYLAFALPHAERPTHLITGLGGMVREQLRAISPRDAVIAVGFAPYPEETVSIVAAIAARKVPIIVMSDSTVSPLAKLADILFEMKDADFNKSRSLTSSLSFAQFLAVTIAGEAA
jgi:DNA-binding MurR/RpiR family transcriptional regulator